MTRDTITMAEAARLGYVAAAKLTDYGWRVSLSASRSAHAPLPAAGPTRYVQRAIGVGRTEELATLDALNSLDAELLDESPITLLQLRGQRRLLAILRTRHAGGERERAWAREAARAAIQELRRPHYLAKLVRCLRVLDAWKRDHADMAATYHEARIAKDQHGEMLERLAEALSEPDLALCTLDIAHGRGYVLLMSNTNTDTETQADRDAAAFARLEALDAELAASLARIEAQLADSRRRLAGG